MALFPRRIDSKYVILLPKDRERERDLGRMELAELYLCDRLQE